jgi:hypothetical protein
MITWHKLKKTASPLSLKMKTKNGVAHSAARCFLCTKGIVFRAVSFGEIASKLEKYQPNIYVAGCHERQFRCAAGARVTRNIWRTDFWVSNSTLEGVNGMRDWLRLLSTGELALLDSWNSG